MDWNTRHKDIKNILANSKFLQLKYSNPEKNRNKWYKSYVFSCTVYNLWVINNLLLYLKIREDWRVKKCKNL